MSLSLESVNTQLNALSSQMANTVLQKNALTAQFSSRQKEVANFIKYSMVALAVLAAFTAITNPLFLVIGFAIGAVHKFSKEEITEVGSRLKQVVEKNPKLSLALMALSAFFAGGIVVGALAGQAFRHHYKVEQEV